MIVSIKSFNNEHTTDRGIECHRTVWIQALGVHAFLGEILLGTLNLQASGMLVLLASPKEMFLSSEVTACSQHTHF